MCGEGSALGRNILTKTKQNEKLPNAKNCLEMAWGAPGSIFGAGFGLCTSNLVSEKKLVSKQILVLSGKKRLFAQKLDSKNVWGLPLAPNSLSFVDVFR